MSEVPINTASAASVIKMRVPVIFLLIPSSPFEYAFLPMRQLGYARQILFHRSATGYPVQERPKREE